MPYYTHHRYKVAHHYVRADVLKTVLMTEGLIHITPIRLLTTMCELMYQMAVFPRFLITNFTHIRSLTGMYELMCSKTVLMTKCLITHITGIRALTTMYTFMSYKTAPVTECLITHITCMRSPTTLYTLMCYHIALFTECLITNFTNIRVLTPTYITGISAFSTVYVNLFIQSTLVNAQRLNIRIYSDGT
jgi:hypothetical protein